ncbi:ABC transporter permease [Bradyrhizobium japonicum]|uniref:ABC transporter permease n=1 Tax=Bradyrhizobium japonicum TaxID=375 RepID=UPI001BAD57B7|nr:ABC transporter permease [Bradyrhizobium japonicum]MBR0733177.1 ABC transporter permease [Bradyrhizobium japonicum]
MKAAFQASQETASVPVLSRLIPAMRRAFWPLTTILLSLVLWQWAVDMLAIPKLILPSPRDIALNLVDKRGMYFSFAIPTLLEILLGFCSAGLLGVMIAVLVSFSSIARQTVYPLLVSSQMIPKVAIAPVLIIWFGTGLEAKVLIAFLIAFFPITLSTMVGLDAVERDTVRLFRSMGASSLDTFFKLRLPTALPSIFAGLKIGMSLAVVGAVVAEFVAAERGLGYYLLYANGQLDTVGVFAALTILTALGVVLFYAVEAVERLVVPAPLVRPGDPTAASM